MRAKFINESIKDILKSKSDKEIARDWPFDISYESYKKMAETLKEMGIKVRNITSRGAFYISGYYIFISNHGVTRMLTRADAEHVADALKSVAYDFQDIKISDDENIYISFHEAQNYIAKKKYNIKEYPIRGDKISLHW